MALSDALQPFVWGQGGARLTPDEVARRRQIEDALLAQGVDTSPVGHWTQGLARVANAFAGSVRRGRLEDSASQNATDAAGIRKGVADYLAGLGGGSFPAAPSSPSFPEAPLTAHAAEHGRDMSLAGGGSAYRDAIASIESAGSGDYAAVGPTHSKMGRALGRYQVMEANIGPWSQAALGRAVTPDEFLANPKIQDAIFDHVFGGYVKRFGPEGAAQAWFAGPGGVGKVDRKDSLGTNVGDYGQRFVKALGQNPVQVASLDPSIGLPDQQPQQTAGVFVGTPDELAGSRLPAEAPVPQPAPGAQAPQPASVQVAQALAPQAVAPREAMSGAAAAPMQAGGINPAIIEALSSPYADEGTRRIGELLFRSQLEQQAAANDPVRALQMQKMQLEIDQARNPQMSFSDQLNREKFDWEKGQAGQTANIKDYDAYARDEVAAGRQPLGRLEFEQAIRRAGAMSVDARNMGSIPQGYRVVYDDKGNAVQMEPIPGGPADTSATDAAALENQSVASDIITNAASQAREILDRSGRGAVGIGGKVMSVWSESDAAQLRKQVEVLKANAKIENLQAMRAASPTGGALGGVSNQENEMLAAKSGTLDPDAGPEAFKRQLDDYERTLLRIVHGKQVGDAIFEQTREAADQKPISDMTDDELRAIIDGNR